MINLKLITGSCSVSQLATPLVKELQSVLNNCNYLVALTGLADNVTLTAFNCFKVDNSLGSPGLIGPTTVQSLSIKRLPKALDLIRKFNSFKANAYTDPSGVVAIGYGSTKYANGTSVLLGQTITLTAAETLLASTMQKLADEVIIVITVPINCNQFGALVSLSYTIGIAAFKTSTLLVKLNQSNYTGAADEILRWNKVGDTVLSGLTKRRYEERLLFLLPV